MFFDFNVHINPRLAEESKRLGYNGVTLIQSSKTYDKDKIKNIREINDDFSIFSGVEIYAKNANDLKNKIQKYREVTDVIIVNGGDLKINRAACEDPRVDMLSNPYKGRKDSGINHIIAKKASENEVAVELSINSLIKTRSSIRTKILSQFRDILKLHHKFGFPIIITSNAQSIYDLRTPKDIIALAYHFGMTSKEAEDSLSKNPLHIIERSRIRKNIIVKGAKKIEDE
ncbi:MAG: ribonuclease P [Methanobacterium sp.]|uniref:ribonuclease P protein component 3 n=1 Tax=Methanobacterium sp. TaxID=2164 RepID=UPI003D660EEE|nr:ribonuclease P [Methanobacterium sp.]